jgi:hypothetical protein
MRIRLLVICVFTIFSATAQEASEEYIAASPCLVFPAKYARLSDSLIKNPVKYEEIMFIRGYFMRKFLYFRLIQTPDILDEVRFEPTDYPPFQRYRNSRNVLFPDSIAQSNIEQLVKVSRWPEEKPLPGFFLIEKNGNHFMRREHLSYKDTITIDLYDHRYYFDRYYLIYYTHWGKPWGGEEYGISGNIEYLSTPREEQWERYLCSKSWIIYARLVMYGIKDVPIFSGTGIVDNVHYWYWTAQASEIGKNNILIQTDRDYFKFNYDVIFFTNDKKFTLDDNQDNIYEIIFSTRECNTKTILGQSRKYEDLQPQRKFILENKLGMIQLDYLLSKYVKSTYNVDYSIKYFNGEESVFNERDDEYLEEE